MGLSSNKNYVTSNAVEAILSKPGKVAQEGFQWTTRPGYGEVPMYLKQNQLTIRREKEPQLGGTGRRVHTTSEGQDVQAYLDGLIGRVKAHGKIQVLTGALVVGFSGYKGNFTTEVLVGPGMYERKIDHGITVVATGDAIFARLCAAMGPKSSTPITAPSSKSR